MDQIGGFAASSWLIRQVASDPVIQEKPPAPVPLQDVAISRRRKSTQNANRA